MALHGCHPQEKPIGHARSAVQQLVAGLQTWVEAALYACMISCLAYTIYYTTVYYTIAYHTILCYIKASLLWVYVESTHGLCMDVVVLASAADGNWSVCAFLSGTHLHGTQAV